MSGISGGGESSRSSATNIRHHEERQPSPPPYTLHADAVLLSGIVSQNMKGMDHGGRFSSVNTQDQLIESPSPSAAEQNNNNNPSPSFSKFLEFPIEIRMRIWESALEPRMVRWTRTNDHNLFTAPSRSIPLLMVSVESRVAAFLYGGYRNLAGSSDPVYFSPKIDYLWFDPGWFDPSNLRTIPGEDPLEPLLPELGLCHNIMIHPNWSGKRRKPAVSFGKLAMLKKILVAADEKSIGFQSKVMLETVKLIQSYYSALQDQGQAPKVPYIAIGCVGWTGEERRKINHGIDDNRQLVKVFEKQSEMNAHLAFLREEEWKFTRARFERPKIALRLRWAREKNKSVQPQSSTIEREAIPIVANATIG